MINLGRTRLTFEYRTLTWLANITSKQDSLYAFIYVGISGMNLKRKSQIYEIELSCQVLKFQSLYKSVAIF